MFRPMRRCAQQLSDQDCLEILTHGSSGVLAVAGDDGYPYAVPLSYVYTGGRIYFHCARQGHKLDALRRCDKASFCVIAQDQVVPQRYTTHYRSVIVFGRVRPVTDAAAMRQAAVELARKYAPHASEAEHNREIDREWAGLCVLELIPDQITGKQARELVQASRAAGSDLPD